VVEIALPPEDQLGPPTSSSLGRPVGGEEPSQDEQRAPGDADVARPDATPAEGALPTAPANVPRGRRRTLRRLLWGALGALLLVSLLQELAWRWRRAWLWATHPQFTRPRTIGDAMEFGAAGLTLLHWLQGAPGGGSGAAKSAGSDT
jgi:hypothetical protein